MIGCEELPPRSDQGHCGCQMCIERAPLRPYLVTLTFQDADWLWEVPISRQALGPAGVRYIYICNRVSSLFIGDIGRCDIVIEAT